MSGENWTPGPWVTKRDGDFVTMSGHDLAWTDFAEVVVRIHGEPTDDPEGIANAHLIAAAPELYEALKDVLRSARKDFMTGPEGDIEFREAYSEAFATLRKARGEA